MVLGKGAENRQKIGGVDVEYNDQKAVHQILAEGARSEKGGEV
jgi:UDP-N-acetylmuramyl tripeptide synthase